MVTPAMSPSAAPALTMAQVDLAINAALTRYKEELAAEKLAQEIKLKAAEEQVGKGLMLQKEQINALFQAIEKLAEMPTADPVNEVPVSFSQTKVQDKAEKRNLLIKYLKDKKTA